MWDEIFGELVTDGESGLTASQTREGGDGVIRKLTYSACPVGSLRDANNWVAVAGEGVTATETNPVGGKDRPSEKDIRTAKAVTGKRAEAFARKLNGLEKEKGKGKRSGKADTLPDPSENGVHAES